MATRHPEELARLEAGDPDLPVGGGESWRAMRRRIVPALRALALEAGPGTLAVVAHQGGLRCLEPGARLGNAEWRELDARALLAQPEPAALREPA